MDTSGFENLQNTLKSNSLDEIAKDLEDLIKEFGGDNINTIYNNLKTRDSYKQRFAGNFKLAEQGLAPLSEAQYLQLENDYTSTFAGYGAKDLATRETFANLIGGNVSNMEVADRFKAVQNRIDTAYKTNDVYMMKQLRDMYPGINDADIMKSMILGDKGADYLKNRLNVADIKAAQDETGLSSVYGAEYLASQGVSREQAKSGLAVTKEQTGSLMGAANAYGENVSPNEIQKQLESENIFGAQSSGKTKRLASQVRGEFSGASGVSGGSLKTTRAGSL